MSRIPYEVDDDDAAEAFIAQQLKIHDAAVWAELQAPDRAVQTWRVLRGMHDRNSVAMSKRRRAIRQLGRDQTAMKISESTYRAARDEYDGWKTRAEHWRTVVNQYLRSTRQAALRATDGDTLVSLRRAVQFLAEAIAEHRDSVEKAGYEPTDFDRLLWARLATVRVPTNLRDEVTAAEYIHRTPRSS